jgi:hypothetical protein
VRPGAPSLLPAIDDWWALPTGRVVSIRRIENVDGQTEAVVRYVDEHGGLAQGEFELSIAYIARGKKVAHA